MFSKLVMRLEEEIRNLEEDVFNHPPETYEKFREMVGRRAGLLQAIDGIKLAFREDDEI